MKLSLPASALREYTAGLLDVAFPDRPSHRLASEFDEALERLEYCFQHVALRAYRDDAGPTFDHLHGDQFAMFLYFLSNSAWRSGNLEIAKKFSLLNRARHAIVIMYDTVLPDIFVLPHTVGTVIGKGVYHDFLVVCQNVTIANDITTMLTIGRGVVLLPGAFVVGTGLIGDGAVITANSTVSYQDVPSNVMVRGSSPNLEVWERKRDLLSRYFVTDTARGGSKGSNASTQSE